MRRLFGPPWKHQRLLLICSWLVLATACNRRAPWPEDCVRFAEITFGYDFAVLVQDPQAKADFDKLMTICLTMPFDRQVFQCTEEAHAPRLCLERVHPEWFSKRSVDFPMRRVLPREAL